jgi:hypothetical protein
LAILLAVFGERQGVAKNLHPTKNSSNAMISPSGTRWPYPVYVGHKWIILLVQQIIVSLV